MTERFPDQNKQMENRFLVSQLDQSDFSHMPNLVGNRQEKQEGVPSCWHTPALSIQAPGDSGLPYLQTLSRKRHPEIPACKSFRSSIPNTFRSLETARDGRISKPGFVLLKKTMCCFICTVKRTTAFLVGCILHKAGRQPPPREVL